MSVLLQPTANYWPACLKGQFMALYDISCNCPVRRLSSLVCNRTTGFSSICAMLRLNCDRFKFGGVIDKGTHHVLERDTGTGAGTG